MRLPAAWLLAVMAMAAEVPPPPDPYGLGERLAILDYLKEHGQSPAAGTSDERLRELYRSAWLDDPRHAPPKPAVDKAAIAAARVAQLRALIAQRGVEPAPDLDEAALASLLEKLDARNKGAPEAGTGESIELQLVRFTDGGTMIGIYHADTGLMEVHDPETGRRAGEMSLARGKIASVTATRVVLRDRPAPVADEQSAAKAGSQPSPAATAAAKPARPGRNPGSDGQWITDAAAARTSAAADHRPILMLFTGSDWCPWCIKLEQEILRTPVFREWAASHVVLLYLDFPRQKALDPAAAAANQALAAQYGIKGYPSIQFTDAAGRPIWRYGYDAVPAATWVANCNLGLHLQP